MNIIPLQFANTRSAAPSAAFRRERAPQISTGIVTGIAIVALVPAIFWTGLIWCASQAFGFEISPVALATIATTIAGFLSIVCSAVIAAN